MVDDRDLEQLNRLYFIVAQNAARRNLELAVQLTGLSRANLERMATLSLAEIDRMHKDVKHLLFKPRMSDQAFSKLLEMPSGSKGAFVGSTLSRE